MKKLPNIYTPAIMVSAIGLAMTMCLAAVLQHNAMERAAARFENNAILKYKAIENGITDGTNALRSVNALFVTAWPVSRQQFQMYTGNLLERYKYIQQFAYHEAVQKNDREAFEVFARKTVPEFRISDRKGDMFMEPAPVRSNYLVTTFVEPYAGNASGLGVDILQLPLYKSAIERGRVTSNITATQAFDVTGRNGPHKAVMLWMPLYKEGMVPVNVAERKNNLVGFSSMTMTVPSLVSRALQKAGVEAADGVDIQIIEEESGSRTNILYGEQLRTPEAPWYNPALTPFESPLYVGNRAWKVRIQPSASSQYIDTTIAWLALWCGLALSIFLGMFVSSRQSLLQQRLKTENDKFKAIEQQAKLEQLHQESARLTDIIDTQSEIARADLDLDVFMHVAAERLLRLTPADGAAIEMEEGDETVSVAVVGSAAPFLHMRIKLENSLSGLCLRTRMAQLCKDATVDQRMDQEISAKMGIRSMLAVPLVHSGTTVGVLKVMAAAKDAFSDRDIQTMRVLANVIGTAIQQRRSADTKTKLLGELQATADALFQEKELAQVTLRAIGDAVITSDIHANVTYLNPVAEELTGWGETDAMGRSILEIFNIVHEDTRKPVMNPIMDAIRKKATVGMDPGTVLINRDGRECAVDDSAAPIFDRAGNSVGAVLVFRDVSQERKLAHEIAYQAKHDPLTGLINRREFNRKVEDALQNYSKNGRNSTLLYLDLDQFKIVNDTCGHAAGDDLLQQVTSLLKGSIRDKDTVARLGGDEFGILLEGCQAESATRIAENLRVRVQDYRFVYGAHSFSIGVSIGLVNFSADVLDIKNALSAADSACYIAKERGRNQVCVFEPNATDQTQRSDQMSWVVRIQKALDEGRLTLYAQPIVPVAKDSDEERHFELLLRMYAEDGTTLIQPMAFIPSAERYNLMSTIDRWVVKAALQFAKKHANAVCSINLSGQSLGEDKFLDFVKAALADSEVDCKHICFEVTETAAIANFDLAVKFITELKALGCRFALDDFGSGMSSFNYLRQLPVDFLKIDGCFVKNMAHDRIAHAMVESINNIGHIMGLKTIAEFVEDDAILQKLLAMGVDFAQGYGVGRPSDASKIEVQHAQT